MEDTPENVSRLKSELDSLGVSLHLKENGKLGCVGPKGAVTKALLERIEAVKAELLAQLAAAAAPAVLAFLEGPSAPAAAPRPTVAQKRLLVMEQIQGPSSLNNMPAGIVNFAGEVRIDCLHRALKQLLQRHSILRSTYKVREGEFVVSYTSDADVRIECIESEPGRSDQQLKALIENERSRVFELAKGPLLHFCLLKRAPQKYTLVVSMHHIITDGWSSNIIIEDLVELYNAICEERQPRLADLPLTFEAYARAQARWLESEHCVRQRNYWAAKLADYQGFVALPRCRGVGNEPARHMAKAFLPAQLTLAVRQFCTRRKISPFVLLLGVFKLLVSRMSGQRDIVIGVPNAGRNDTRLQRVVGYFINHLALRTSVEPDMAFEQFLQSVQAAVQEAAHNQDIPFECVLEQVKPPRTAGRAPLFNLYFNYQNDLDKTLNFCGGRIESISVAEALPKFDLTLYVHNRGNVLEISCSYNPALFGPGKMERLLASFQYLTEQILQAPQEQLAGYRLQRNPVFLRAQEPVDPEAGPESIPALIFNGSAERMQRPAVTHAGTDISYRALLGYSQYYAAKLRGLKLAAGSPVAIVAAKNAGLVVAILAAMLAGHCFVLVAANQPPGRRARQLALVKPQAVLVACDLSGTELGLQEGATTLNLELKEAMARLGKRCNSADFCWKVRPQDVCYLSFTSGSEGEPKVVAGTHASWLYAFPWFNRRFDLNAAEAASALSGIGHDPLHRDIILTLCRGATIYLPQEENLSPSALRNWLATNRIAVVNITPSFGKLLLNGGSDPVATVRHVFFAGEPLTAQTAKAVQALFPHASLTNLYGATETQQSLCFHVLHKEDFYTDGILAVGRGNPGTDIHIVGSDGSVCGIDEVGEIVFSGPLLVRGYVNDRALTEARFQFEGAGLQASSYRTGDLGRIDDKGLLHVMGRKDQQISINGFRVEPAEIESALQQLHGIAEARVVKARNDSGDELRAYVKLQAAQPCLPAYRELRRMLQRELPAYMLPSHIIAVDEWPLTGNGKLNHKALLDMPVKAVADIPAAPPATEYEACLHRVWCSVLRIESIPVTEDFYAIGGQSLQVARILAEIYREYSIEISYREFFENSTIRRLADFVAVRKTLRDRSHLTNVDDVSGKKEFFL